MVHMRAKPVKPGLIMKSDTVPVVGHVPLSPGHGLHEMPCCQLKMPHQIVK